MKHLITLSTLILACSAFSESRHSFTTTLSCSRAEFLGPDTRLLSVEGGAKSIHVICTTIDTPRKTRRLRDGTITSDSAIPYIQGSYTGLPLGDYEFIRRERSSAHTEKVRGIQTWTNFESCSVSAEDVPEATLQQNGLLVEKLARLSLAKYAADQRIRAGASQAVNGRSLAGFTAQKSNVNFVRFADWATARGIQYSYDSAKCTISFTRNGKSILLPIAAKAVRVNGTWRDLPDIVMISPDREERTLVPVALDALTN